MLNTIRVAYYLAVRQLFRKNLKSVTLIVFVMMITFLNLVAVSGILVGLIEGSSVAYRSKFIGDLVISPLENKKSITDTDDIVNILNNIKEVKAFTVRYQDAAQVESNYNKRDAGKRREIANMQLIGISAEREQAVTKLGDDIIEGEFLSEGDTGKIVVGKNTLGKYAQVPQDIERSLGEISIGDTVLVTIGGKTNEFTIKGVLGGKTDVTRQGYISVNDFTKITGKLDSRANTINVRTEVPGQEVIVQKILKDNNLGVNQKVETYAEGEPAFVKQLKDVFSILGNVIGGVGIVVAIITIYIVIYINAITRRKYIGIMKGIGISPAVIELSYIFQSIFYGVIGSLLGAVVVYFVLIPLFIAYPIDFPFSDGIMVAPYKDTLIKFFVLIFFTVMAGYIPARSIVKQNTLNAILGR